MTVIINNHIVSGKPEEIKELLDLYKPPVTTAESSKPEAEKEADRFMGKLKSGGLDHEGLSQEEIDALLVGADYNKGEGEYEPKE